MFRYRLFLMRQVLQLGSSETVSRNSSDPLSSQQFEIVRHQRYVWTAANSSSVVVVTKGVLAVDVTIPKLPRQILDFLIPGDIAPTALAASPRYLCLRAITDATLSRVARQAANAMLCGAAATGRARASPSHDARSSQHRSAVRNLLARSRRAHGANRAAPVAGAPNVARRHRRLSGHQPRYLEPHFHEVRETRRHRTRQTSRGPHPRHRLLDPVDATIPREGRRDCTRERGMPVCFKPRPGSKLDAEHMKSDRWYGLRICGICLTKQ